MDQIQNAAMTAAKMMQENVEGAEALLREILAEFVESMGEHSIRLRRVCRQAPIASLGVSRASHRFRRRR